MPYEPLQGPASEKTQKPGPPKVDPALRSHPLSPRELKDNEVYSQLQGMLRGVGENYT
jgi:hypothetical protein